MYIPHYFDDSSLTEVNTFIKENGFGILINQTKGKFWASHIPMELILNDDSKDVLVGHISRGNRQWKGFKKNDEVLAIFQGPHSYVSPTWYKHDNVPTWNYIAVHVYGRIKIIEGEQLYRSLESLMDKYEAISDTHLSLKDMPEQMVNREVKGIIGFEILINEVQAAYKLSQNRDQESYDNITRELSLRNHHDAKEVADIMIKRKKT